MYWIHCIHLILSKKRDLKLEEKMYYYIAYHSSDDLLEEQGCFSKKLIVLIFIQTLIPELFIDNSTKSFSKKEKNHQTFLQFSWWLCNLLSFNELEAIWWFISKTFFCFINIIRESSWSEENWNIRNIYDNNQLDSY